MQFDDIIGFVIFIVFVVISIAQRIAQAAKQRRATQQDSREIETNAEARDRAERRTVIENIPVAQPREGAPQPQKSAGTSVQIEDVIRRLMGESIEGPSGGRVETVERPLPPPVPRHAPTQYSKQAPPRQAPPPRNVATPPPRRPAPQQPTRPSSPFTRPRPVVPPTAERTARARTRDLDEEFSPEELEQRQAEQQWREEMERRKKSQKPQTQRPVPELLHTRPRLMSGRRRLFHSASEVRRAIILAEVLAPPRAMREIDDREYH